MNSQIFIKKILFLFLVLLIIRLGSHVTVPMVNPLLIGFYIDNFNSDLMSIINTFSGGSFQRFSIFTIGIMPYITASIVIQIFTMSIPYFKDIKAQGEKGQNILNKYTKNLTIITALGQAFYISTVVLNSNYRDIPLIMTDQFSFYIVSCLTLLLGTLILVWLAEKINEYGIGNGVSMIIFCSIISALPDNISGIISSVNSSGINNFKLIVFILGISLLYYFVVFFENSNRKIPIINSQSYTSNNYMPFKVNLSGVMPTIFAFTVIMLPFNLNNFISNKLDIDLISLYKSNFGDYTLTFYVILFFIILFFSFLYSKNIIDSKKISNELRKNSVVVKGIRPGKPTENYFENIRIKLSVIGAVYLTIVSFVPEILNSFTNITFYLGGTSILIMVVVAGDIKNQYDMIYENNKFNNIKTKVKEIFNND